MRDPCELNGVGGVVDVLDIGLGVAVEGGEGTVKYISNFDEGSVGYIVGYHLDSGIIGDYVGVELIHRFLVVDDFD